MQGLLYSDTNVEARGALRQYIMNYEMGDGQRSEVRRGTNHVFICIEDASRVATYNPLFLSLPLFAALNFIFLKQPHQSITLHQHSAQNSGPEVM